MSLYSTQTISGYNTSAPSDDGSETDANQGTWAGVKTKLADPVKTLSEAINTQLVTAFASVGVEKISSGTVASAASLDITDLSSSYFMFELVFEDLVPASDGVNFLIRTSADTGGSPTFDTGASDYAYMLMGQDVTNAFVGADDQAATSIVTNNGYLFGTTANEEISGSIRIYNPTVARFTVATFEFFGRISTAVPHHVVGGGVRSSAAAVNAFQVLMSSGNIASMNYVLYGYIS